MHTLVTGATGFIGSHLVAQLESHGHSIVTLTRNRERAESRFGSRMRHLAWVDTDWRRVVQEADMVFHLAGASVAGQRWTREYKREIRDSRITTTEAVALAGPRVLVSASAVGFYGGRGDEILTEQSPSGDDFLADVCVRWEEATAGAVEQGGRVVCIRIGQVLGQGGGTLDALLHPPVVPFSPFRLGLGGVLGDGRQWMPWVHLDDILRLFLWCAENEAAKGPFNAVAPNPVTNNQFTEALGRVLHRPTPLPVPALALRALLGEFADYILYSQRVLPERALNGGYSFKWNDIESALRDILVQPGK